MDYNELLARYSDDNVLFTVVLELTFACNLDCFYCYNDRNREGRLLSLNQYELLLEDLRAMETMNIVLTGGEPLSHPDFFAIGRKARDLGFVIRLKTNGHAMRREIARKIRSEIDPYKVEVSLHGARASTHDRQTRVPGSFDRLMDNLEVMQEIGFRIKLDATLTKWNEDEIEEMLGLAESLGLPISIAPTVSPRDDGSTDSLDVAASREGVLRLFRIQMQRADERREGGPDPEASRGEPGDRPRGRVCGAGSRTLTVDPWGNVLPCVQWRRPVGSLRDESIQQIWQHSAALMEARKATEVAVHTARAMSAEWQDTGFCPGLAEFGAGSPSAPYETARVEMELRAEARKQHDEAKRPVSTKSKCTRETG